MAKLGAYYGLCPLIDHRSLLGISEDEENGVVIVTLGKNIAIKFKLSDQKQLCSWRTKDKFSSPIIYDKQQSQYVAAFNDSFVRQWNGNEEFLDKLKKLKFNQQIHTIFKCNDECFIVFKSGAIYPLQKAIENRKDLVPTKVIESESCYIVDVLYTSFNESTYVGLIVKSDEIHALHWTRFDGLNEQNKFYKVSLQKDNELVGYAFHVHQASVNFFSVWSDSRIYSTELKEDTLDFGELFTAIESVSCKNYVSMISLDQNYIAMYGCNSDEEGALLVIYNVQFKVVQTRQLFKLFTNGAKIWCVNGNLLFPVGQNLAVVPFNLDMEQLAALVGSHKVIEENFDPDIAIVHKVQCVSWGKDVNDKEDDMPDLIQTKLQEYMSQGLSKSIIFDTLLQECMEDKNTEVLKQAIKYFDDIPESALVKVLKLILNLKPESFKKNTMSSVKSFPHKLQPEERSEILDMILCRPFNETLIFFELRSSLNIDDVILLLEYIYFLFSEDGHPLPLLTYLETEAKLIGWMCILLDANYQRLLLTKDEKVNEILTSFKDHIKEELNCSDDLQHSASLLRELKKGKPLSKTKHMAGLGYSIEEFPLY
ncbi:hypothetical protein Zmor_006926 [Zophobas morio]|uniref:Nucleolar protein 11 n=1 Tax=Zophobas morio TaxID=2755281 RepID=A0AA38MLS8_9CUCU|nr:hypothetical protein Zmor_006926 [Zophobas morio]